MNGCYGYIITVWIMDPAEVQFFTGIVEKYSSVYKKMLHPRGRGKKAAGF